MTKEDRRFKIPLSILDPNSPDIISKESLLKLMGSINCEPMLAEVTKIRTTITKSPSISDRAAVQIFQEGITAIITAQKYDGVAQSSIAVIIVDDSKPPSTTSQANVIKYQESPTRTGQKVKLFSPRQR